MNRHDQPPRFALCIRNGEYAGELEIGKVYEIVPDADVERDGEIRVIDESGEDYIYPTDFFHEIELPHAVGVELRRAS